MKDIDVLGVGSTSNSNVICSSTKNLSENSEQSSSSGSTRKKKTRRKTRQKANSVDETEDDLEYDCVTLTKCLKISSVTEKPGSRFIRVKNIKRRIRIYSFICHRVPVIFGSGKYSEESINLCSSCTNLKNQSPKNNVVPKTQPRDNKKQATQESPKKSPTKKSEKKTRKAGKRKVKAFEEHFERDLVNWCFDSGDLVRGTIRINPRFHQKAYVGNEDKTIEDYVILGVEDRNRALEGDEVALLVKPEAEWKEGKMAAQVVAILKQVHPRLAVGHLKLMADKNKSFATLVPRDSRLPRLKISSMSWPPGFYENSAQYENVLFLAKILKWEDVRYANGILIENLGVSGDLKAETRAILNEYELDTKEYSQEIVQRLKLPEIAIEEYSYRKDFRDECVFTIDPATARDLDDALSLKELSNGNLEIGVHIADVAFFFDHNSKLDLIVREKATTIYLVDSTYHMLPLEMCLFCSLLPGQDKRAFSVIWEMTKEGEIVSTQFTRSVINSCAKLAYEHAQMMIENPEASEISDMPQIQPPYTTEHLSKVVNQMNKIAVILRRKRFENGALALDQSKLSFKLNPTNGEPESWSVYELKDANRMIEEFMLLANISVATEIKEHFPDMAFLRHHEVPNERMLREVKANMESAGVFVDISSAGSLNMSLEKYRATDYLGQARFTVLNHLLTKPMKRANYFCANPQQEPESYHHYALNVPLYTHFTSPIRRYADIVVHRLLAASLGYCKPPTWLPIQISKIAVICNKQKYNAKRAGDASIELYFAHYIEAHQPFIQDAIVVDVKDKSFDVIILTTGFVVRVYLGDLGEGVTYKLLPEAEAEDGNKDKKLKSIEITFQKTKNFLRESKIIIDRFAILKVALERKEKSNKLSAKLERPVESISFERSNSVQCYSSSTEDYSD